MFAGGVFVVVGLDVELVVHPDEVAFAVVYECGIEDSVLSFSRAAENDP